jgi:hypothetical protein
MAQRGEDPRNALAACSAFLAQVLGKASEATRAAYALSPE